MYITVVVVDANYLTAENYFQIYLISLKKIKNKNFNYRKSIRMYKKSI